MALSDQLTKLAARAKEAEDHAAAAKNKAKAELEADVKAANDAAQAQAEQLRTKVDADKGKVSDHWSKVQRTWNDHLAHMREDIHDRRAEHDLKKAQRNADGAEEDAVYAIDFAYGAIEEAEYAVLDAVLARTEADELASVSGGD
jgi:hypothetical protein